MKRRELSRLGRRLYGPDWQSPLARTLGVHRITVWRWLKANHVPPEEAKKVRALK